MSFKTCEILLTDNRMLRDAEYFKSRIGILDGASDTADFILNIVKGKPVPKTKVATPTPPVEGPTANGAKSESATENKVVGRDTVEKENAKAE